jgi:hypothetical protein
MGGSSTGGRDTEVDLNIRETCCRETCNLKASLVLKIYTDDGYTFMPFCRGHMMVASEVIAVLANQ